MANEPLVTVIGNLTADPELRYIQNGVAVVGFTVASTPRRFDKSKNEWEDGNTLFLRATAWRELAENIASDYRKGERVIVTGRLVQENYETKEGEKRSVIKVEVDDIGRLTARTKKNADRAGGPGSTQASGESEAAPSYDPNAPF